MKDAKEPGFVDLEHFLDPNEAMKCSSALLAEAIPHRTEWRQVLSVPKGMEDAARAVVDRILAGTSGSDGDKDGSFDRERGLRAGRTREGSPNENLAGPAGEKEDEDERESGTHGKEGKEEDEDVVVLFEKESVFNRESGLFDGDTNTWFGRQNLPPSEEEMRVRPVWPARALAMVPGLGLGHLYAGKHQLFFYLVFSSVLGVLFYQFTGSYWSFLLVAFAWAVDLGFAAYHVKAANQRALQMREKARKMEKDFLDSVGGEPHQAGGDSDDG